MAPHGGQETTPRERYDALLDLSPSAKYVYTVLQNNGTLTKDELAQQTLLPARTISYALERLSEAGLVEREVDATDARCRKYSSIAIARPDEADSVG